MCESEFSTIAMSSIRSPGALLREKKNPQQTKLDSKNIELLLEIFKVRVEPVAKLSSTTPRSKKDGETSSHSKMTLVSFSQKMDEDFAFPNPGKMKNLNDDMCRIIDLAKQILSFFGVRVEILVPSKDHREVFNLLKCLVPEICLFPLSFWKLLKIKKLCIYKGDPSNIDLPSGEPALSLDLLNTEEKIIQRLYKIIFNKILIAKPDLITSWKRILSDEDGTVKPSFLPELEENFMKLMKGNKYYLLNPQVDKLMKLLAQSFSEEITEEWFKNRNKERKKGIKIRFDFLSNQELLI